MKLWLICAVTAELTIHLTTLQPPSGSQQPASTGAMISLVHLVPVSAPVQPDSVAKLR